MVVTNHRATVSGTAAGSTIIAYVITAADITRGSRDNQVYRGSKAVTVFTTLRHGDSYRFTISARNAAGTSATSAASKSYRL